MPSGRDLLMNAVRQLLAEQPERQPSTREICDAAGVAAPTLYHHFGTKDGLLAAAVEDAFATYLERKRSLPRTGDLLADFVAGWHMHVEFGVDHPALYRLMYARPDVDSAAARTARDALRAGLDRLEAAGLLTCDVDAALTLTTSAAIGCVFQLHRTGGRANDPLTTAMCSAVLHEITGAHPSGADDPARAATGLISWLGTEPSIFTPAEVALLHQWLLAIATADPTTVANGAHR